MPDRHRLEARRQIRDAGNCGKSHEMPLMQHSVAGVPWAVAGPPVGATSVTLHIFRVHASMSGSVRLHNSSKDNTYR